VSLQRVITDKRIVFTILLLGVSGIVAGCNIVTPLAIILAPEPTTDAVYELQDRPTVVFVDDRRSLVSPSALRGLIADRVSQDLMTQEVVTTTINPRDAVAVARQNDDFDTFMPIAEIGKAVGAEQVIYIEMLDFREQVDQVTYRPHARCQLRVIDVVNRVRLYPTPDMPDDFHVLDVMMGNVAPEAYRSRATLNEVARSLAEETGSRIAKLFYKHNSGKLGTNLEGG